MAEQPLSEGAWLSAPVFSDPERNRISRVLHPISLTILALLGGMALLSIDERIAPEPRAAWLVQALLGGVMVAVVAMLRSGRVQLAAGVFSSSLWFLVTLVTFFMGGLDSPTVALYVLVAVLAGFLWGGHGVMLFSGLSLAAATGMLALELAGLRPEPIAPSSVWYAGFVVLSSLVLTVVLIKLSLGATEAALAEAHDNERAAVEASRAVEAGRALLETRAREQAAVAELGQLALAETDIESLLVEAVRVIGNTLGVDWVSILERLPGDEELLLRAGIGWPDDAVGKARFPMSLATQAGYTLLTGHAVVVEEHEREERFPASYGLRAMGVVSSLSVVIPGGGDGPPYGVLGVHSRWAREYSDDDIRFLEGVANLVALAIRRAHASQDLRAREEELRQSQKMEAVGRLAGGIAHDFNNLLTAISGYTNFLLDELEESHPGRSDAEEIRRMTEQAASLTGQILAVSRRHVVKPAVIDLNAVVADAESMLQRVIGEDIELATDLQRDLPPVVADPGQVEQVLLNLVLNARDAMPEGGQIHIRTVAATPVADDGPHATRVRMEVTDTGIGMDEETQARAFDPFFTTKGRFEGTGLGLSTVYGIVQQADGSITLSSRPGRGTAVRILLPASEAPLPAPRERSAGSAFGSETVLLAEDEPTVRRLMRRVLDAHGYVVLEAPDGAEALRLAERHKERIDLVVTDVVMPELSGGALAEKLKDVHPESRVLYVSGYADDAIARHGVQSEDAAFLAKPFTADDLACKVREVLDASRR